MAADESKTRFSNNNKSYYAPNNNQPDNRFSLPKTSTIAEIAGLPPLIISKNPLRTPGLSNKHSNLTQQNRLSGIIYPSKTAKRSSTEADNNNSIYNESSNFLDESFSTQDLRDITNKELLMNSSKRAKF